METIDPNDQTNQHATETLLEKSRALKEKAKQINENLDQLRKKSDLLKETKPKPQKP